MMQRNIDLVSQKLSPIIIQMASATGGLGILSLKQFMVRSQVLSLYRDILRTLKNVHNPEHKAELAKWARTDFEANRHQTDEEVIKMMLTKGRMSLREMRGSLALSR